MGGGGFGADQIFNALQAGSSTKLLLVVRGQTESLWNVCRLQRDSVETF